MSAVLTLDPPTGATTRTTAPQRVRANRQGFSFGKYREIIIAVAFFLLFDLGVLVLNFYTSFRIAEDALGVNLSGRQRMLSQRTAKALLSVDAARAKGAPADADLEELRNAVKLFDASLKGFQHGATVPGGDGKPVHLPAAEGPKAEAILAQAQGIWTPYQQLLAPVLAGRATDAELQSAVAYARANNLKILGLMNELTTALEAVASERASNLRAVQTGGIVLALLNFAFILFKFLGRLRTSDAAIEAANEENREILTSVREGLFLITPDFKLGSQLSQSAHALFGRLLHPGDDFFALLQPLVSEKALADARDYVQLLFAPHVKEALVQGINPLSEVEVFMRNRLGQDVSRHLSFHFNRVQEGGAVRHLLVTVQDISARILLERKLASERQRSQKEFAMLLSAVDTDPAMLRQFVLRAESNLLEVNDLLRSTSSAQGEAAIVKRLDEARRRVHAVKGDAATMGLETIASQAHQFENELDRVRQGGGSGDIGNSLLALPMPLEELLNKVAALKSLGGLQRHTAPDAAGPEAVNSMLSRLADTVASETGRQVQPVIAMGGLADLEPRAGDLVREIAVQLLRNAVTHGIEPPQERRAAGKVEAGKLWAQLMRGDSEWTLVVRDDGAGISAGRVRSKLLALKWYSPEQLESFDDRQVVAHIFKPGFSTAAVVGMHAGRGVGLDVVQANVQKLGARITLSSTPGQFTEFRVRFAV
ncbi:MAG: type IV pili methyl-accepting chemotaxis transducer N-terminal domain-containing protein [Burkholderiales bacterium]|nr:type IV pili methyl-accepting chemotaxis transducer N-terminal domain-containing protein [Burkholderiales bacterium]